MSPAPAHRSAIASAASVPLERRLHRRYPISLKVQYKLLKRQRVLRTGDGISSNISSGGIAFEADTLLPSGSLIEVSVNWPLALDHSCPLQLKILGHVVRSGAKESAVKTDRYEFRTTGSRSFQKVSPLTMSVPSSRE